MKLMKRLMKQRQTFTSMLCSCFLLLLVSATLHAQQKTSVIDFATKLPAPKIVANAWVLMEYKSGWVVTGHNVDQHYAPASITKLMTNYVVFSKLKSGEISLQDQVSISEKSWRAEGSRMFAEVNSRIELQHLLKSTIIQSGNDAAIALAEHVAGSEEGFAALMNRAAHSLGMTSSHFVNSTGLPDDGHYMSAIDIAKLSVAIVRDFPEYYPWYAEKEYTHNNITQYNRNRLLWKAAMIDGLKTGYTQEAGYCLVGSANNDGVRWIAVVLGASDEKAREQSVMSLLRYGYAAFESVALFNQQGGVTKAAVYKGEVDEVHLQSSGLVNIVVPTGRADAVQTEIHISPFYMAPIEYGQAMGLATLSVDGQNMIDVPLIATSTVKQGKLWKRLLDGIKLRFRRLFED